MFRHFKRQFKEVRGHTETTDRKHKAWPVQGRPLVTSPSGCAPRARTDVPDEFKLSCSEQGLTQTLWGACWTFVAGRFFLCVWGYLSTLAGSMQPRRLKEETQTSTLSFIKECTVLTSTFCRGAVLGLEKRGHDRVGEAHRWVPVWLCHDQHVQDTRANFFS